VDEIVRAWAETSAAIEMAAEPPAVTAGTALQATSHFNLQMMTPIS